MSLSLPILNYFKIYIICKWPGQAQKDSSLAQGKILVLEHSVPGRWQYDVLFRKGVGQRGLAKEDWDIGRCLSIHFMVSFPRIQVGHLWALL